MEVWDISFSLLRNNEELKMLKLIKIQHKTGQGTCLKLPWYSITKYPNNSNCRLFQTNSTFVIDSNY